MFSFQDNKVFQFKCFFFSSFCI